MDKEEYLELVMNDGAEDEDKLKRQAGLKHERSYFRIYLFRSYSAGIRSSCTQAYAGLFFPVLY